MKEKSVPEIFKFIFTTIIVLLLKGFIVLIMWNIAMPDLTGFASITYLHSLALILLSEALFYFREINIDDEITDREHNVENLSIFINKKED